MRPPRDESPICTIVLGAAIQGRLTVYYCRKKYQILICGPFIPDKTANTACGTLWDQDHEHMCLWDFE